MAVNLQQIKSSRREAKQKLKQLGKRELAERIDRVLLQDVEFRMIQRELNKLHHKLHRKRVEVTRKEFAIKVRNRRLENIPVEIRRIRAELQEAEAAVAAMEREQATLLKKTKHISQDVSNFIKGKFTQAIPA